MLATQGQNQTLSPQQFLAAVVTHLTSSPSLLATPNAHSPMHYP